MGEYVGISIGNYDFIQQKNTFGDLLSIFNPQELKIEDNFHEDGEKYTRRYFSKTVYQAKMCLDVMGHTLSSARSLFEYNKEEYLEYLPEDIGKEELQDIREEYTFEAWKGAVGKYASILARDEYEDGHFPLLEKEYPCDIAERIVYESVPFFKDETYFGIELHYLDESVGNYWDVFRVVLEAFDEETMLILDYTNLHEGGWCGEYPDEEDYRTSMTVVLTEGSSDATVIREAMRLLYPAMVKYFSFIDFSTYDVQGSTNYLTHYLKAFIAAGIENRIIALYDNDSAGLAEIKNLKKISFPNTVRIMHLPDLDICNEYPTIGPSGENHENVNGRACSIEMFLGKDVICPKGKFIPIRWKSYVDKVDAYQGEIVSKTEVLKKFEEKTKRAEKEGVNREEWIELDELLKRLFMAFIE